jgi:hypothetical protein
MTMLTLPGSKQTAGLHLSLDSSVSRQSLPEGSTLAGFFKDQTSRTGNLFSNPCFATLGL